MDGAPPLVEHKNLNATWIPISSTSKKDNFWGCFGFDWCWKVVWSAEVVAGPRKKATYKYKCKRWIVCYRCL